MSRNPYLAASRPSSSFTRSSRTSKRNDLTSNKSSLLGRSRSSAALGGLTSSSYIPSSGYTPSSSTLSWQRSASSNRLNRQDSDLTSNSTKNSSSYKASDYTPANSQAKQSDNNLKQSLYKSISSSNLSYNNDSQNDVKEIDNNDDTNYLQNYQQNKLQQQQIPQTEARVTLDSKRSTVSLNSTDTELSYDDSECIRSGSAPRHLRQANLLKSQSLDIKQQPQLDTSTLLSGSMSVDRLLLRSESMTERELRKSYKDLVMENERLKRHLKSIDDIEKQKQQDWIRKERQLERKISELEEENKQLEQWRHESQRLKDENSSLIRVLSKISKKH